MSGFFSVSDPIRTERSMSRTECPASAGPSSVPDYLISGQHRTTDARSHVVRPAIVAPHGNDAAVAAAQTASHDALDRYLAGTSVFHGRLRRRREHPFRSARVEHDRRRAIERCEPSIEWRDDTAA